MLSLLVIFVVLLEVVYVLWLPPMRDQSLEVLTLRGSTGTGALNLCASLSPTPLSPVYKYMQTHT